jgi:hypothetical protein
MAVHLGKPGAKRVEHLLKELRSLPANKRCFHCDALGTTYICPQFAIFVCTTCSGAQ